MYIRRTKVKGGPRGEVYITHRLVESVRTEKGVREPHPAQPGQRLSGAP
jgi:hypothetical protein